MTNLDNCYYITCEKNCSLVPDATIHRVLAETKVLHTFCCKPSYEGQTLPERYVIKYPKGKLSRAQILKTVGVVRVRTFDGAKNQPVVRHC